MLRKTAIVALSLIVLLAAGIAVLGSEATLRWAVGRLAARSDGALQAQGVSGSLFGPILFERLSFRHAGTDVTAQNARIEWAPLSLLWRHLDIHRIQADSVSVALQSAGPQARKPVQLPERLSLPVTVSLHELHIDQLALTRTSRAHRLGPITVSARADANSWSGQLKSLDAPWGKATGNIALNTQQPFAIAGFFQISKPAIPSYNGQAQLGGTLSRIDVRASAQAQPATADAAAILTVFAATPFERLQVNVRDVDPRVWRPNAPTGKLDLHFGAEGRADRENIHGRFELTNHTPGTLEGKNLPLAALTTSFEGTLSEITASDLLVDLGKGGTVSGSGSWRGATLTLTLQTRNLNLQGLHGKLKRTRLAGDLRIADARGKQRAKLSLAEGRYRFGLDGSLGNGKLTIEQVRAAAGPSAFVGNGSIGLGAATKPVALNGTLTQFDPSKFGKYPKANINSRFKAAATLSPILQLTADLSVFDSELFGAPAIGTVKWHSKGTKSPDIVIDLSTKIGNTRAQAKGTLLDPMRLHQLDLQLELEGRDMAELYPIIGIPLPPTPAYKLAGHLRQRNRVWEFRQFTGQVGQSDLSGNFVVDRRQRQVMRASLVSNNLVLSDLSGFIGAQKKPKSTAKPSAGERVLPDDPFRPDKLQASDADVFFTGRRIVTERLPLTNMTAHLKLSNGVLVLDPLNFGAAGGNIVSRISLDARQPVILGNADIRVDTLKLDQLNPGLRANRASFGDIEGRAQLATQGNSVADMLGSADGKVALLMDGGAVSDLVLRLMDLDIAHVGVTLLRGDRNIPVRCMIADFATQNGHMRPTVFVLDTEHTNVGGSGEIDLRDEALDLRLIAKPKDNSLAALRGPIVIGGSFGSPSVRPELSKAIARGGAAILLGIVATPLAAFLPLMQFGKGKDADCAPLVAQTRAFINGSSARKQTSADSTAR